jgi:hypothetical protein
MAFKMKGHSLPGINQRKESPIPYKGVGRSESIKNTKNKTLKTIKKYNPFDVFDKDNVFHDPAKKAVKKTAKAIYKGAKSVYKTGKEAYKSYQNKAKKYPLS